MEAFVFSVKLRYDVSINDWHLARSFSAVQKAPAEFSVLIKNSI
jgi:hypothetical protein